MSKKTILVTGGCRSGKSRYALSLSQRFKGKKIFLATAQALDEEMRERIEIHKKERGKDWTAIEEPLDPVSALKREGRREGLLIVDCLTLWICNLMMAGWDREPILKRVRELVSECQRAHCSVALITNEVGAGIVPENKLSRDFRDIAGEANQLAAQSFNEVTLMVSGVPVAVKSSTGEAAPAVDAGKSPHEFTETKKQGLYEAIYKRRDVRHFTSRVVDPAALGKILHAAHHAGSVGFMQPWNFIVIDDPETKRKVKKNFQSANSAAALNYQGDRKKLYGSLKLEGIVEAPINICVTCDSSRLGPHVLGRDTIRETDVYSVCCAIQNLWLAARAEGLAVGWLSILSREQLKRDLEIPDRVTPVAYLCVGHTENFYEKPMLETRGWESRLPLSALIYYNKWNGAPGSFSVALPD
ncbi:MAG: 5,6-dimethylbenzimidazole synthase [Nitrospinae bacterium]|nr:5,6-dimethylbenzimidazole synthase [Nitrospinota bacterium]